MKFIIYNFMIGMMNFKIFEYKIDLESGLIDYEENFRSCPVRKW